MATGGWIDTRQDGDTLVIAAGGDWQVGGLGKLIADAKRAIPKRRKADASSAARVDLSKVDKLDSSGAWLLNRLQDQLTQSGYRAETTGADAGHRALLERAERAAKRQAECEPAPKNHPLLEALNTVGKSTVEACNGAYMLLSFFGLSIVMITRSIFTPWTIEFRAMMKHIETTGLNALPIVGLLSFLIGVVIAYMGALQLERFGAAIFTVNLVGVGVLRELGVLVTAILIAGRSGSAFTAQIGTMKVNQEVDAMQTIGLDPIQVLVLPRIMALMIALPLLTIYANMMGLAGGAVISFAVLDISLTSYVQQLGDAVDTSTFFFGISKAPVFAYLIALVGCYEGMRVTGSAESVGKQTTTSVVEAIFLVIVVDAIFAVISSYLGF